MSRAALRFIAHPLVVVYLDKRFLTTFSTDVMAPSGETVDRDALILSETNIAT